MKKGRQRQKSNPYERKIAAIFTQAYYPMNDGEFRKVPLSGGWDKSVVSGDILALKFDRVAEAKRIFDNSFPLSVECKTWADENVKHFFSGLYSAESELFEWMEQAVYDSRSCEKTPVVVFKLFRTHNIIMIRAHDWYEMKMLFGDFNHKMYFLRRYERESSADIVFVLLADFLDWIDWGVYKLVDRSRLIRSFQKRAEDNGKTKSNK